MKIHTCPFGPLASNMYIVEVGGSFVVVDPSVTLDKLAGLGRTFDPAALKAVFITHGHFDHTYRLSEWYSARPDVPYFMSPDDLFLLNEDLFDNKADDMLLSDVWNPDKKDGSDSRTVPAANAERFFADDSLFEVKVLPTPGHSPGSVCFQITDRTDGETALFTGDTVFRNAIGRSDLPGGNLNELMNSVEKIKKLDGSLRIFPGHGPDTTVSLELRNNPYFF